MKRLLWFCLLLALGPLSGSAPRLEIVKRPLPDACSRARTQADEVTHLMVHFCSNAPQDPAKPYQLDLITKVFADYGVGAHYLIDRQGTVYELIAEARVAYHAGKGKLPHAPYYENQMNAHSIGVELMGIGTYDEMKVYFSEAEYNKIAKADIGYTQAQYAALKSLIAQVRGRHPGIKHDRRHIVGHDEYAPGRKTDPGKLFSWPAIGL
jgi:N-acetyl-anhydromuramyl-L-alanine amidase AmpD